MIRHDPIEDTPEYQAIEEDVERRVKAIAGEGGYLGFCHRYWATKKKVLREVYGIDWKSPAELNEDVFFD